MEALILYRHGMGLHVLSLPILSWHQRDILAVQPIFDTARDAVDLQHSSLHHVFFYELRIDNNAQKCTLDAT